jgi:hypothetical protein
VAESTNEEPAPDATEAGQLTPGQARVVGGLEASATSEATQEVLGEPATGTELTLVASSPPVAVVDSTVADAPKSLSLLPATPVDKAAPAVSLTISASQEHDVLGSAAGVASPEIQEAGEGSGAGLLSELEEGSARVSNLARFSWAAAFEVDTSVDEDEESAACRSIERGLLWAHRTFDELILPATTVSLLDAVVYSCLVLFFRNL